MSLQYAGGLLKVGALVGGDNIFRSHNLVDRASEVGLKAEVAVGNDANEHTIFIHNRNTANVIFLHHVEGVFY